MGIFKAAGKAIKTPFVRFPTWLGFRYLWGSARGITRMGKGLFVPTKSIRNESFEEAVARLNLTDADIKRRMTQLWISSLFYLLIALSIFIFAIYLFRKGDMGAGITAIAVTFLALVFVFRDHFHYFQMKRRELGGSFGDWLKFCLGIKKR